MSLSDKEDYEKLAYIQTHEMITGTLKPEGYGSVGHVLANVSLTYSLTKLHHGFQLNILEAFAQVRLKAAIHYTVAQMCEEKSKDYDVTFSKQVISALSEATFRYSQIMTRDLELFAKHAKRATITPDDVKLLVRKSPQLLLHIQDISAQREAATLGKKQKGKKKKASRKEQQEDDDDFDENS